MILTWFILCWIKGRGTLLLQFIKSYMLFRIPPAPYWCLGPPDGRNCRESIFGRNKRLVWEGARYLVHSRPATNEYTDMSSYLSCYSRTTINKLIGVEKWRFDDEIYVAYHFVIICLIVKMWLMCTYQSHNYRWKLKLSWNFICKTVYFIHFNSCLTMCFCSNIDLLYVFFHSLSIYCDLNVKLWSSRKM